MNDAQAIQEMMIHVTRELGRRLQQTDEGGNLAVMHGIEAEAIECAINALAVAIKVRLARGHAEQGVS